MMSFRATGLCAYLLLFAVVLVAFIPCAGNDFVDWDDYAFVARNHHIASLSAQSLSWMFTTFHQGVWHPLTWFSHALDRSFWGLNPSHHHLMNVIIHCLNVVLFCALFVKLQEGRGLSRESRYVAAFSAALLFGVHPLRVESVAWIAERKDVLCSFFFLASIISYINYARAEPGAAARGNYLITLGLCALALLSKPMAITLPFVFLVIDFFPLERLSASSLRKPLLEKIPFLLIALAVLGINVLATMGRGVPFHYVPLDARIMNACHAIVFYVAKTVWPAGLIPLYQIDPREYYFGFRFVLSSVIVAVVTAVCIRRALKKDRIWASTWFYYLITLAPALGLFMPYRHARADRYTYLPTLGLWILVGLGIARVWEWAGGLKNSGAVRSLVAAGVAVLALVYAYAANEQIRVWKNGRTLWTHVIHHADYVPDIAFLGLGRALEREGDLDGALANYEKAFSLNPGNFRVLRHVAGVTAKQGKLDQALSLYETILEKEQRNPVNHMNVGNILRLMNRPEEAGRRLEKALEMKPGYGPATLLLTLVHLDLGRMKQARDYYRQHVTRGFPRRPEIEKRLGKGANFHVPRNAGHNGQ